MIRPVDAPSIAVVGAGAFGTALALAASRAGRDVALWCRTPDQCDAMVSGGENARLPGFRLGPRIRPTTSWEVAASARLVILATPAQALREIAAALAGHLVAGTPVLLVAKGIERTTGLFVTEVVRDVLPGAVPAILSGPGFAADIARGAPTALTLASTLFDSSEIPAALLGSPTFRIYRSIDVRGVEIGGAAKNVLAIAAGVAAGRGFGESSVAAVIARGFAELLRFGTAHGAQTETLCGLSGLGDLILTGTSSRSRNRRLGEALGAGMNSQAAIAAVGLAEGAWTAAILVEMAQKCGVEMPVCEAVAALLDGRLGVDGAIDLLLSRPARPEGGAALR